METNNGKEKKRTINGPTNPMVTPLLTDLYQFTMAYAYWKAGKHNDRAVFDLYFRRNPFGGEYTVFAGLEECIRFIANFKLSKDEIAFVRECLSPTCEDGFFDYLGGIDCSDVEVYAIAEGSVVFPKVPLMRIEGPVAVVQLLETPFVNLINFASLVTTNAARHRFVAGKSKLLLEFGLRRAQGPDGGVGASRYCYMGGFDATSNCAAGKLFGIPLRGTHSHAFVSSFTGPDEITEKSLKSHDGSRECTDFVSLTQTWLGKLKRLSSSEGVFGETNQSELAAFVSYALAFPNNFLALVDTYDVSIPCKKRSFRLYGKEGYALVDIMSGENEPPPKAGQRILCRHPFSESKRAYVVPQRVEDLMKCYWPGSAEDKAREELPTLEQIREHCMKQLEQMRTDHMRRLNPTPYKVTIYDA
ncbi:nicotinate phosphoribosyltransferase 2-like protein [Tanacetum coccineum]|uniref:Nicotinate phosphoribosyltransferase n=1 Tax=Tanacetum coccineum TaxID=301880 RepID=A0ABQ5E6S7_9ASTR